MANQEDEDLQMALRMSLQSSPPSPPEPKRSRPGENVDSNSATEESSEARRRLQRELMAAAAEKRISMAKTLAKAETKVVVPTLNKSQSSSNVQEEVHREEVLSIDVANHLFVMMFGEGVSRDILSQWSNQGIRFSSDLETSMGLVQHEGGPCGVLAAIQAFVLKYVLFHPEELGNQSPKMPSQWSMGKASGSVYPPSTSFSSLSDEAKSRALVLSMVEILFSCGNKGRAVIASIKLPNCYLEDGFLDSQKDEIVAKSLETLSIESSEDLQRILRVNTYYSEWDAYHQITSMLSIFQSRMGAMLFLISSLLSRGLESVQEDRDDPSLPLVTAPFGHASQEIVNLLLCGEAVPNVFDGKMDLGGGMSLKGIPTNVEVGFLTLLESLNFCKVGQHLKCPRWPIWVVGSESHYTVLFALETSVQDENELEERESKIRRAFDNQDQSGGGGFISVEGFQQVIKETNISFPPEKVDNLCSTGFIVWSEFWQALLQLDKSKGGMKDSAGLMGKKQFDLYHFNGIAKSVPHSGQMVDGENPTQRPRLSKLRVAVPPKWTPEEFLADVGTSNISTGLDSGGTEVNQPEPSQQAPLVDCIRTRWPRAICSWTGDAPSIV